MGFPKIVWKSTLRKQQQEREQQQQQQQQEQQQEQRSIKQPDDVQQKEAAKSSSSGGGGLFGRRKKNGSSARVAQDSSAGGSNNSPRGKKKKGGIFGAILGKSEAQKKREALLAAEEEEHQRLNHSIRLTLYLQAKFTEEANRAKLLRDEDEAYKRMHYQLRLAIYLQALENEGATVHERFLEAQNALQRGMQFREPLTETEAAGSDPTRTKKKKKKDPDQHEISIGIVPPSLMAMINAAAMELRPVPEQHKKEYKPIMNEAADIGRGIRLPEKHYIAYGTPKPDPKDLDKSIEWNQKQRVALPNITNKRSKAQQCVVEAAALGRIRRLKPKVTYNYQPSAQELDGQEEEDVDVDEILDEHGAKDIRTRHLTNQHINHIRQEKKHKDWDPDEQVHYKKLEDVQLPSQKLPLYKPRNVKKLSHKEYMEGISRGVAEYSWDRRYRLDRPNRELRITQGCTCKYCKTSNPYQTNAYRKKWLVKQGLWTAPPPAPPKPPPTPVNAHKMQIEVVETPRSNGEVRSMISKLKSPNNTKAGGNSAAAAPTSPQATTTTPSSPPTLGADFVAPTTTTFPPPPVETHGGGGGGDAVSESVSTPETQSSNSVSAPPPKKKENQRLSSSESSSPKKKEHKRLSESSSHKKKENNNNKGVSESIPPQSTTSSSSGPDKKEKKGGFFKRFSKIL